MSWSHHVYLSSYLGYFWQTPLKINGAPRNIQGNLTDVILKHFHCTQTDLHTLTHSHTLTHLCTLTHVHPLPHLRTVTHLRSVDRPPRAGSLEHMYKSRNPQSCSSFPHSHHCYWHTHQHLQEKKTYIYIYVFLGNIVKDLQPNGSISTLTILC